MIGVAFHAMEIYRMIPKRASDCGADDIDDAGFWNDVDVWVERVWWG